jgi:hypothetical protein
MPQGGLMSRFAKIVCLFDLGMLSHPTRSTPSRELAIQLRRDIKPILDAQGVQLFFVSIGTLERSKDFVSVTEFPAENLLADPESKTYKALGLVKGIGQTFFNPQVIRAVMWLKLEMPGACAYVFGTISRWSSILLLMSGVVIVHGL